MDAVAASIPVGVFAVWFFCFGGENSVDKFIEGNRGNIYRTLATIAGTLLGFLIAGVSLVINNATTDRFAILRESEHYPLLWKTFFQAIRFLGALTVAALVCLIWQKEAASFTWLVVPLCFLVALAVVRLMRVIWVIEQIVTIGSRPSPSKSRIARGRSSKDN